MIEPPVKKFVSLDGGTVLGTGIPKVCVPVIGRNAPLFLKNLEAACSAEPDLIELRIDTLSCQMSDAALLSVLQQAVPTARLICPVILTDRSTRDGGDGAPDRYTALLSHILTAGLPVDLLDIEISSGKNNFTSLQNMAAGRHIPVIASWHDFNTTPSASDIGNIFDLMQTWHADIGKIAVMPQHTDDVDRLTAAAAEADKRLSIPIIAISMGALGTRTRLECEQFGSCMTFASALDASAPGQVGIADVKAALSRHHVTLKQKG